MGFAKWIFIRKKKTCSHYDVLKANFDQVQPAEHIFNLWLFKNLQHLPTCGTSGALNISSKFATLDLDRRSHCLRVYLALDFSQNSISYEILNSRPTIKTPFHILHFLVTCTLALAQVLPLAFTKAIFCLCCCFLSGIGVVFLTSPEPFVDGFLFLPLSSVVSTGRLHVFVAK